MDLETKRALIHQKALQFNNKTLLEDYDRLEKFTVWSYHHYHHLLVLSSNYDVEKLTTEDQQLARSILSNKDFIPVLIDKMLEHDSVISFSMYKILYKNNSPELLLEDGVIFEDDELITAYLNKGGDAAALAEMNAEVWLESAVGELYLEEIID